MLMVNQLILWTEGPSNSLIDCFLCARHDYQCFAYMNYNVWVVPTGLHKPRLLVSDPQPVTTFLLPFVLYFPMTEPKPKIKEGSQVLIFLTHAWPLSSNIFTDVFYTVLSPAKHLCLTVFKNQISVQKIAVFYTHTQGLPPLAGAVVCFQGTWHEGVKGNDSPSCSL